MKSFIAQAFSKTEGIIFFEMLNIVWDNLWMLILLFFTMNFIYNWNQKNCEVKNRILKKQNRSKYGK